MRKARLIGFLVAILLGVAGGLVLGWLYFPAEITTTSLQDLRADHPGPGAPQVLHQRPGAFVLHTGRGVMGIYQDVRVDE